MERYELVKGSLVDIEADDYAVVEDVYPWDSVLLNITGEKCVMPINELSPVSLEPYMLQEIGFKKNRRTKALELGVGILDIKIFNMAKRPTYDPPEYEIEVGLIDVNIDGNEKKARKEIEYHHELMAILENCRRYRSNECVESVFEFV